jgi:hypothetical protein
VSCLNDRPRDRSELSPEDRALPFPGLVVWLRKRPLVRWAWVSFWFLGLLSGVRPLWQPGQSRGTAVLVTAGAAVFIAAAVCAFAFVTYQRPVRQRLVPLVAAGVLAFLYNGWLGSDWTPMFIYLVVVSAMTLPLRAALATNMAIVAAAFLLEVAIGEPVKHYGWVLVSSALSGLLCAYAAERGRIKERLQRGEKAMAQLAVNEERVRFARDLHDLLGHSLSLLSLKAQLAGRLVHADPDACAKQIAEMEEISRQALAEVRRSVFGNSGTPVNLLRPRARRLLLDALWQRYTALRGPALSRLGREDLQREREDFTDRIGDADDGDGRFGAFLDAWWPPLTPRQVLTRMAADRRLLSRAARRILTPAETDLLADSWKAAGEGRTTVADVALLDELRVLLAEPAAPRTPREVDPVDQLTGLDEVTTYADRMSRMYERERRAAHEAAERTDYAHIIVDEAQDLTPMQWRMIGRRARSATWTIVGDPAQSSWTDPAEAAAAMDEAIDGFTGRGGGRKPRRRFELTTNYRNPKEIAEVADVVLARAYPEAVPPTAVRATGVAPRFAAVAVEDDERFGAAARSEVARLLEAVEGTVGLVVPMERREEAARWIAGLGERAVALGSLEAKGLEYDATVVADPSGIAGESEAGLRVLYVALTRATQRLTVLSGPLDLPDATGRPALLTP